MKKLVITIFTIALLGSLNAQEKVIKVNPAGFAFGAAQLSYERALNSNSAFELSLTYLKTKVNFVTTESKISGFGGELKYKIYFSSSNDAPRGWYAAPLINYSAASGSSNGEEGKVSAFSGGAVAGYQWIFGGRSTGFALDLNLGAQYISSKTSGYITSVSYDGILPRLGISLGYAW